MTNIFKIWWDSLKSLTNNSETKSGNSFSLFFEFIFWTIVLVIVLSIIGIVVKLILKCIDSLRMCCYTQNPTLVVNNIPVENKI